MEKRLPIALLLSFVVIVGWQYFFAKPPPVRPAQATPPSTAPVEAGRSGNAPANASGDAAARAPVAGPDALGQPSFDSEERTLELRVGTPGQAGSYFARFSNRGARLLDLRLGDSFDQPSLDAQARLDIEHWTKLVESVPLQGRATGSLALRSNVSNGPYDRGLLDDALWRMKPLGPADAPTGVEFELQPGGGVRFVKRVRFLAGNYDLDVEFELTNEAATNPGRATFVFTPAEVVPLESGDTFYIEPQAIAAGRKPGEAEAREKPEFATKQRDDTGKALSGTFALPSGPISFAGVHNKYFAVLARAVPESATTIRAATWRVLRDENHAAKHPEQADRAFRFVAADLLLEWEVPKLGETQRYGYRVYAGPKAPKALAASSQDHLVVVHHDLGFFLKIAQFLLWVLNFFHSLVGNWGVAIILLTLSVRIVLFPLTRRSQTAMARYQTKMKRIQPQIDAIKKKYEKDPAKLRQEQTLIMQREGAFPPLGGCLPMFLQIPVFFGLFSALRASYDLRQAPFFGWIHDLAKPDALAEIAFNTHLPFIGTIQYFNLLPILMVVLWVLQQRMMPKPTDEQAARMQKIMMIMPIFMGFFLYSYAAGLSLYMITQSGMGIVEQLAIKRLWPVDATELPPKQNGFFARMAKMQEEQQRRLAAGGKGKPRK